MQKQKKGYYIYVTFALTVYLFFFLLISSEHAGEHIAKAVDLCLKRIIPSLFPFLVLTEILVSSNAVSLLGNTVSLPLSIIFKIKKESSSAFIFGALSGFPIGTKTAVSLYENQIITKNEAERLICFCSNTGPAFTVGILGRVIGAKTALTVYLCQLLSAVLIGIFLGINTKSEESRRPSASNGTFSLTKAITSSVMPMLNVCAFVCFFSCISCSVEELLSFLRLGDDLSLFFTGFLEITNGITLAQSFGNSLYVTALCAFFVGWSGLSVILQSLSITSKHGFDIKKYLLSKLLQGVLCALFTVILCKIFKLY